MNTKQMTAAELERAIALYLEKIGGPESKELPDRKEGWTPAQTMA